MGSSLFALGLEYGYFRLPLKLGLMKCSNYHLDRRREKDRRVRH